MSGGRLRGFVAVGGTDADHFQGLLDEVTVSRVARPPHWIKLAYATQKHLASVVSLEILK